MGSARTAQIFGDSSLGKQQPAGAPASAETPTAVQRSSFTAEDVHQRLLRAPTRPEVPAPRAAAFPVLHGVETQAEVVPKGKLQVSS